MKTVNLNAVILSKNGVDIPIHGVTDKESFELVAEFDSTVTESTLANFEFPSCRDVFIELIVYPNTAIEYYGVCELYYNDIALARIEMGAYTASPVTASAKIESMYINGLRKTDFSQILNVNGKGNLMTKAFTTGGFYKNNEFVNKLRNLKYNGHIKINVWGVRA